MRRAVLRCCRLGPVSVAAFLTLVGMAAGSSCFIDGFVLVEQAGGEAPTPTGATGGGGQGGAGGAGVCSHATWPAPPDAADPGTDTVDFVVVARSIDFGEEDVTNGATVGYDLDNHCTCQGEDASCREPAWAAADHCDGPAGRDNAVAELFHDLATFDDNFTSALATDRAERGGGSILIRVRSYNGQANDDRVTVSIHPSRGRDEEPCLTGSYEPLWDGTDMWPINANSLNVEPGTGGAAGAGTGGAGGAGGGTTAVCGDNGYDPDDARYVDDNAYVSDWELVANLPQVALEFVSGDDAVPLLLTAGFVTGRIESQDSHWYLRDSLVVGRWKLTDFFRLIGRIRNNDEPLCTDNPIYPLLKSAACQFPDIAAELSGPTTPCDAMSLGMAIQGYPAVLGSVLPTVHPVSLCTPDVDPQFDTCEPE